MKMMDFLIGAVVGAVATHFYLTGSIPFLGNIGGGAESSRARAYRTVIP